MTVPLDTSPVCVRTHGTNLGTRRRSGVVVLLACALGLAAACSSLNIQPETFQVPGTPSSCTGEVYFQVPAMACFTFGCTSSGLAYALCVSGAYTSCSCGLPCSQFSPGPGSAVSSATQLPCNMGSSGDEGGTTESGVEDAPSDAASDVPVDAPPRDAHHDSPTEAREGGG
jgi:hypothetical protein